MSIFINYNFFMIDNTKFNKLFIDLSEINGIGTYNYSKFKKLLNLEKVRIIDLLWHFPTKIIQRNNIKKINELIDGETQSIIGKVVSYRKGFRNAPHQYQIYDGTDKLELLFFKLPFYMLSKIKEGETKYISGKVKIFNNKIQIAHPDYILSEEDFSKRRDFEPIYPLTSGLTNNQIILVFEKIFSFLECIDDWHNKELLISKKWLNIIETFKYIHMPIVDYTQHAETPIKRIAYDEILINQIKIEHIRHIREKNMGISMNCNNNIVNKFEDKLPFKLSKSQKFAIDTIYNDMSKPKQMIRLLQGDVGSGKTLVSFFSGLKAIYSGYQFVLMAPTEILASQHYENFTNLVTDKNIKTCLLTSNTKKDVKKKMYNEIANGEIKAIIGTHSLFQDELKYKNIGLIVIDEQHRFGLHQRLSLQKKSKIQRADLLLMTATPIPRTLIQIKYGDIDVSELDNLTDRKITETSILSINKIDRLSNRLNKIINNDNKVFWVCPQILSNSGNKTSVMERYKYLQKKLNHPITLIHGKMSENDKSEQLKNYMNNRSNILVATSVIEVGIDIKEANIIVIENADSFGLSQLHQLRGRVGRNDNKSWCVLLHDNNLNEISKNRLKIIKENSNGFSIAEQDMLMRGYGDILGNRQSGFTNYRILNEEMISELIMEASTESKYILQKIYDSDDLKHKYKYMFDFYEAHEFNYLLS